METKLNKHNNFVYLTLCLVVFLLFSALGESLPDGVFTTLAVQAMSISTLVVAYISLDFGQVWRRTVLVLVLLIVVFSSLGATRSWVFADFAGLCTLLLFFCVCTMKVAREVLFSKDISPNHIVGSISIYLMLGLIWTTLYLMVLEFYPEALHGLVYENWGDSFDKVLYFSYVTLATLGYGDMSPAEPITRVLAFLEAITGTFYMAIVVASLISANKYRLKDR